MSGFQGKMIVAPVDFSNDSFTALCTAVDIASNPSDVHVVYVIPQLNIGETDVICHELDDSTRKQHAAEALHKKLSDEKYSQVQIDVVVGDPGHCVADFSKQIGADLIVIPTHWRAGLAHALMGSVAERVARLSRCPVLELKK